MQYLLRVKVEGEGSIVSDYVHMWRKYINSAWLLACIYNGHM